MTVPSVVPCASAQLLGQRQRQEDALRLAEFDGGPAGPGMLSVICDGMGGHVGGEVASALVADHFVEAFVTGAGDIPERLHNALAASHQALMDAVTETPELEDMGTTLVAACIVDGQLYRISVGDSQLWQLRNHQLQRLNEDHSMAPVFDSMVAMGEMTPAAARTDSKRHALRSAVTRAPIHKIDAPGVPTRLHPGDRLLLASDGLDSLPADTLRAVLDRADERPQQTLERLLHSIREVDAPQQDNTSVILLSIPGTAPASDKAPPTAPVTRESDRPVLNPVLIGLIALALLVVLMVIFL